MLKFSVFIVIATTRLRSVLKSLKSVYEQVGVRGESMRVILACDGSSPKVIQNRIHLLNPLVSNLRKRLGVRQEFITHIIPNTRTYQHSGTGAWNSSVYFILQKHLEKQDNLGSYYLAFLDDDDTWDKCYLKEHLEVLKQNSNVGLVASGIKYRTKTHTKNYLPSANTLTKEQVFIKNPYIQGSNLFISLEAFLHLGCFDESLKSATDRDLVMRYLELCEVYPYKNYFIDKILVSHNAKSTKRVTTNLLAKQQGLDIFYYKYSHAFCLDIKSKSQQRAKDLFNYEISPNAPHKSPPIYPKNPPKQTTNSPYNLILAFVSYDLENIKKLLHSFLSLQPQKSVHLKDFRICLLTTCDLLKHAKNLLDTIPSLKVCIQSLSEKKSISQARSHLQHFSYEVGTKLYKKDFITWIVDDDLEFKGFYENKSYKIDYFAYIANGAKRADCLLGGVVHEPPIPFYSTLRVQLVDIYYYLCGLKPKALLQIENTDYYYDLSTKDFMFLEFPLLNTILKKSFYSNLETIFSSLSRGQMSTRKLTLNPLCVGLIGGNSIYRGGNSIIYDSSMLKVCNFSQMPNCYNRRSDFNWCIVQRYAYQKTIKTINLPLFHSRLSVNSTKEIQKIQADLEGIVFYRVFLKVAQNYEKNGKFLSLEECRTHFYCERLNLRAKVLANVARIEALTLQINRVLSLKGYPFAPLNFREYIEHLKTFAYKKQSFSKTLYHSMCNKLSLKY